MDYFPLGKAIFITFHSRAMSVGFKRSEWFSVVFCHFMRDELNKLMMWAGQQMSYK